MLCFKDFVNNVLSDKWYSERYGSQADLKEMSVKLHV